MLILGVVMAAFLRVATLLQRGEWPSESVTSPFSAFRALVFRRRRAS
jgi:hypothetical protein